jgi:hypothetical protein
MFDQHVDLLLTALGARHGCFILGAGASAPEVPTIAQLPGRVAAYASHVNSWPASLGPDTRFRSLISTLIERARLTGSLKEWKQASLTDGSVAAILQHMIASAHSRGLPQSVFRLFPVDSSVVSFNWDGLAQARCPQVQVVHPHGRLDPSALDASGLDEALDETQFGR